MDCGSDATCPISRGTRAVVCLQGDGADPNCGRPIGLVMSQLKTRRH